MRMPPFISRAWTVGLVAWVGLRADGGTDYSQDFDDPSWTNYGSGYVTVTNEGWYVQNCRIQYARARMSSAGALIQSPVLTSGIGRIRLDACNFSGSNNVFSVAVWSNGIWITIATYTNATASTTGGNLTGYTNVVNFHTTNTAVRIEKGATPSDLFIDNIDITWAPARTEVSDVTLLPAQPVVGSPVEVRARVIGSWGASNVVPWVLYRTLSGTAFTNSVSMSLLSGNQYETDGDGLPALSTLGGVEYYIQTVFRGSQGVDTNVYPAGAPTSAVLRFTVQPLSTYPTMEVTGALSQSLAVVDNYLWEKAIPISGALTNPVFAFRSGTLTWGDANPSVSNLPVYGIAETGAVMTVAGVVSNPIVFRFVDGGTNALQYSIQHCTYINFDDWVGAEAYGTYTNAEGWVLRGGAISTTNSYDTDRALWGRFCLLRFGTGGGTQFLSSPLLPQGVGSLSFRYRHRDDPTSGMAGFLVQTSTNGTDWVTVGTAVTNVRALGYLRHSVSPADPDARYVRIFNYSVPSNSWLCLDEVVVTPPAATVRLGNPGRSPSTPSVGEFVSVSIDITAIAGGATNLAGYVYFRHTNDSTFTVMDLTRQTNRFVGTLPPMPEGPVRYYFMCTFEGFGAGPVFFPPGGATDPNLLVFTNSGVLGNLRVEDFATWPTFATYTNFSTNGWTIISSRTQYQKARLAYGGAVRSSLLSNGIGTVRFDACAFSGTATNTVTLQTSPNGVDWTDRAQFRLTNSSATGATPLNCITSLLDRSDLHVRIVYSASGAASPPDMFIDNIMVSPAPADVTITEPTYAPGYPSTNEPITVWCEVSSVSPVFPAYGLSPKVYHRMGSSGAWTVTPMSFVGTNRYRAAIGPYPVGEVSYFIRCDFSGYYYYDLARGLNDNQSPAFSPDAPPSATQPTTFYTFRVRPYRSDYAYLVMTGNFSQATMELVGEHLWLGVIDPANSNRLEIGLAGYGYYTGSGYSPHVDAWGATSQARTNLPAYGGAALGGTNIVIEDDLGGQVVILADLAAGSYLVLRGAYQDFNTWYAPTNYFDESLGRSQITRLVQNFDDWPLDAPYTTWRGCDLEDFQDEGWTTGFYANATFNAPAGWYVDDVTIIREMELQGTNANKAAALSPDANYGEVWPFRSTLTDGLGSFSFRYRAWTTNWHPTIYSAGSGWKDYSVRAVLRAEAISPAYPYLSLLSHYVDPNNYYEYRLFRTNLTNLALHLFKKQGGVETRLAASGPFAGSLFDAGRVCELRVVTNNSGTVHLEAWAGGVLRASVVDTTPLHAPGAIGIVTMEADIMADDVRCTHMHIQRFDNWSQTATGNYVNAGWSITNGRPTSGYCLLVTNGLLQTPRLPYEPGWMTFSVAREAGTNVQCMLYGSPDGSTWDLLDVISGIWGAQTRSNAWSSTSYRYFRWVNTSTTSAVLRVDDIYIAASTNFYGESFDSGASGWTTAGKWYYDSSSGSLKRPGYNGPSIGLIFETATTNGSSPSYPMPGAWTNTVTLWASNLTYATTSIVVRRWDRQFVHLKHTVGDARVVVDDLTMTSWRATNNTERDGWKVVEAWVAQERPGSNYVELWRSRANPDAAQSVRTPWMSNGVGTLSFRYRALYGEPAAFDIEAGYVEGAPNLFTETLASLAVPPGATNWQSYELILNTNAAMYLRVRHTSTNQNSVLALDSCVVTDYAPRDERTWTVYNALITYTEDAREFEPLAVPPESYRTCYLNNHPSNGVLPGRVLNNSRPYLQSPRLPRGVGGLRFWYRNWETTGNPAGRLHLYWTDSDQPESTPFTNWNYLGTLGPFTNTLYRQFITNVYEGTAKYLRFYTETTGAARVCLDNVLITEPMGASFDVDYLRTIPEVPLTNQEVRFEARLSNFFYNPSNFDVRVYYTVGSNLWATWTPTLWVPLLPVASNAGTLTYRTPEGFGIAPKPLDSVVQYFLSVAYQGLFAEKNSPRVHKRFSNPSWYEPVNLNAGKTNTNPYYFVFSCSTNDVWINEVNYEYWWAGINNEYVEICGKAGVHVRDWSVQLCEPFEPYAPYAIYRITNITTLSSATNGFGFWLVGDVGVSGTDAVFTHTPDGTRHLRDPGGIRLVRSMGAYVHSVSYGDPDPNMQGFEYIGHKDDFFTDSPLFMSGTGPAREAFSWAYVAQSGYLTPRAPNVDQLLLGPNAPPPEVEIRVLRMGVGSTNLWLAFTGTNTMSTPVVWYSTNLLSPGSWARITNSTFTYGGGVYTQWFTPPTNWPGVFFRVVATNTP